MWDWLLRRGFPPLPRLRSQTQGRSGGQHFSIPASLLSLCIVTGDMVTLCSSPKGSLTALLHSIGEESITPLHYWLSTQKAERMVPEGTLGKSVWIDVTRLRVGCWWCRPGRGLRSCSTPCSAAEDPDNEWSSANVPSAVDEAEHLHSPQLRWNPSSLQLHSSSQLGFYQWETSRGLFINCARKCLYVYSPESSGAEKSFLLTSRVCSLC